jgi:multicomponent K+:H+ antiporter subunit G
MNHLDALPPWAAITVAVLVLLGALFAFIGSIGLLDLKNFYKRVHAPTLGTTLGTFFMLAGSITCFSVLHGRPLYNEILNGVFLSVTTPITLMLLVRAALYRDREEGSADVPRDSPSEL